MCWGCCGERQTCVSTESEQCFNSLVNQIDQSIEYGQFEATLVINSHFVGSTFMDDVVLVSTVCLQLPATLCLLQQILLLLDENGIAYSTEQGNFFSGCDAMCCHAVLLSLAVLLFLSFFFRAV